MKAQFAAAIRRLLRPAVRQMIACGISYPVFSQIAKELFVEVAESDFPLPFKRQTDSHLALVTGLKRKEVARLRDRLPMTGAVPVVKDTLVTHLIGRWMAAAPDAAARLCRDLLPGLTVDARGVRRIGRGQVYVQARQVRVRCGAFP